MAFSRSTSFLLAAAVASVLLPAAAQAAPIVVSSPDGRTAIRIEQDASQFTVARRGKTVIAPSPLGLELDGAPDFGPLALERREDVKVDRTIPLVATKASSARDHYRGATLVFRERTEAGRRRTRFHFNGYRDGIHSQFAKMHARSCRKVIRVHRCRRTCAATDCEALRHPRRCRLH